MLHCRIGRHEAALDDVPKVNHPLLDVALNPQHDLVWSVVWPPLMCFIDFQDGLLKVFF
jgi:hypothetical protein